MIQNLLDKHGDLEKKYDKYIQKQRGIKFTYRNCWDKFELVRELKNHKEDGCSSSDFKCDECEKYFKDENKLVHSTQSHSVTSPFKLCWPFWSLLLAIFNFAGCV